MLSKSFFDKQWPQYELDGLAEREMRGRDKVILPIWHGVGHEDVLAYSPALAGKKAVKSSSGVDNIVTEIISVIHPQKSPLIIARDILLDYGTTPPVITDQFWLEVVEASNRAPSYGAIVPEETTWGRWSFPLPPKNDSDGWGERLAWTALQIKWGATAEEVPICITTHPDKVLDFIYAHPGLLETCKTYPSLVVEYAPQITIPGMGGELESIFEDVYQNKYNEEWCLRHPKFGGMHPESVAGCYFSGGMFGPPVSPYEHADHLFWLLSTDSNWLPGKIHSTLIEGMKRWKVWTWDSVHEKDGQKSWSTSGSLFHSIFEAQAKGVKFEWTDNIIDDLKNKIRHSIELMNLSGTVENIYKKFRTSNIAEIYIKYDMRNKTMKKGLV